MEIAQERSLAASENPAARQIKTIQDETHTVYRPVSEVVIDTTQSPEVKDLAHALARAQAAMRHAEKNAENPHFKSTHADLSSVIDACREPLSANGLSYSQQPVMRDNRWILVTKLYHSSGQWISSEFPILSTKNDAQGFMAGLTYARRGALAAIAGVAQDDDDGNAAAGNKPTGKQGQKKENPPTPPPERRPVPRVTNAQLTRLFTIAKIQEWSNDQLHRAVEMASGGKTKSLKDLPQPSYETLVGWVEKYTFADWMKEIGSKIIPETVKP